MKDIEKSIWLIVPMVMGIITIKLVKNFGLPFDVALATSLFVFLGLLGLFFTMYAHIFTSYSDIAPFAYPVVATIFFNAFFPPLQYKAGLIPYSLEPPFWGTDWFQVVVNILIIVLGYTILYFLKRDKY